MRFAPGFGGCWIECDGQELKDALGPVLRRLPLVIFYSCNKFFTEAIDLRDRKSVVVDLVGVFFLICDYGNDPR